MTNFSKNLIKSGLFVFSFSFRGGKKKKKKERMQRCTLFVVVYMEGNEKQSCTDYYKSTFAN